MSLQEKQQPLVIKVLLVIVDLVFSNVFMELLNLLAFVLIVLNLSEIEEASSFLALLRFLFFFYVAQNLLLGKNKYAFS